MVVHFPIVLMLLLPISVIIALIAIRKGTTIRTAWVLPAVLAAALAASAFAGTRTGEAEEDRVERLVSERALHSHEEAAERFLVLSGVLLMVTVAGFLPRSLGRAARMVTVVGALAVAAAGVQVGHSGGMLVYAEGAARAYTASGTASADRTRERHDIPGAASRRPRDRDRR
jgi:hypothetical protein